MTREQIIEIVKQKIQTGEIVTDKPPQVIVRFPRNTPIRYVTGFYMLPGEIIAQSRECRNVPRSPMEALNHPYWLHVLTSDICHKLVMEGMAYLAWPHLGIADPKEVFSANDPLYRWIYSIPLFIRHLSIVRPMYSPTAMFKMKRGVEYPIINMEAAHKIMGDVVKSAMREENMEAVVDYIKHHRCEEDFDKRQSFAKIDFLRKWYHTRNLSNIKQVPLDDVMEDQNGELAYGAKLIDKNANVENTAVDTVLISDFKKNLSERDMKILEMRMEGYTFQEIANILGYSTHSAVKKRIDKLAEMWLDYVDAAK